MEIYIIIVLAAALVCTAAAFYRYQRQIHGICRQLAFLEKNESNMMITYESGFGEVGTLAGLLNRMLEEEKRRERDVRRREKLISDTYTNLSHDIRTPLTSLDGYFQLLGEAATEEERTRYEGIIRERIASLKELLEELFTFAKLKDTSYELELSPCGLTRLTAELILSYYGEWTKNGITPQIELEERELTVEGNELALRRTIQNLVKNALVHGTREIFISLKEQDGEALLRIANRTPCPEEIDVSQVFDRFYKADPARGRTSSGLGLSIAREFVLHMGGRIEASLTGDIFAVEIRLRILEGKTGNPVRGVV